MNIWVHGHLSFISRHRISTVTTGYSMSSVGGGEGVEGKGYNERAATRLTTATKQARAWLGAGLAASCSHSQSCSQLGLHWFSI